MRTRHERRLGYTLVELLVVIGIVAMMTGLAVPALGRIGGFFGNKSDEAARELYGALRAARIYSITFHTDTAVFYTVNGHKDTYDGGWSYVADGFGIARRANAIERESIAANPNVLPGGERLAYVMVEEPDARFRRMPRGTCITGYADANASLNQDGTTSELPPHLPVLFQSEYTQRGMLPIYLFRFTDDQDGDGLEDLTPVPYYVGPEQNHVSLEAMYVVDGVDYSYPAHVFSASGELVASGDSPAARFVVNVGPAPETDVDTRFTIAPGEGSPPILVAPVRIELYRSTGRVKITS